MEGVRDRERREGRLAPSGWTKEHSCLEGANKEGLGDALSRHGVAYGTEHTHIIYRRMRFERKAII
jgi:hypothetical protein